MITFLTVVILIVCFLLGAVILVQNPKGGGLATGFQGASQIGGVQRTTNFLEKATWYLAVVLFVLCIVVGSFAGNGSLDVGVDESFAPTAPIEAAQ
ncbi:MAG: preprotein translocase subunit SecG [Bacteroidota bacterium]|nr:preprotein translocase subunit SecG [Bacteroidota bacterium]